MVIDLPVWVVVGLVMVLGLGVLGGVIYLARVAILLVQISNGINALLPVIPVVISMANQFKRDSGSSLRDEMDKNTAQGVRAERADEVMSQKMDNLRAEQTRLALNEKLQPATTNNISVTGDTRTRAGNDLIGRDKAVGGAEIVATGEAKKVVVIEGTIEEKGEIK